MLRLNLKSGLGILRGALHVRLVRDAQTSANQIAFVHLNFDPLRERLGAERSPFFNKQRVKFGGTVFALVIRITFLRGTGSLSNLIVKLD